MRESDGPAATADDFATFLDTMSRLLDMMRASIMGSGRAPERGGELASQSFLGQDHEIRLICLRDGARPFLAVMDKPWRHRVALGRLDKDGKMRVFSHGLRLFYDFLAENEMLARFRLDLRRAVELHRLGRAHPETGTECPLSRQASDPGGRVH
ncbi:hypothetical protein [Desulfolutivibrio sulfoxidireducens]|uniref:hypothetical protein n=1 Tax=Desulfolutivibrio sulfoxidireducens TaxID=2773299 RepID=UPI00159DD70D|nr:hypothetical protein [Desulfolutivibrio sulfoxidireducens]QLA20609.1 hypothetical protein GD604_13265 [Desulfolutivibrio sulfoxidireducens]